jgi:histidine triad (HIT) family protein
MTLHYDCKNIFAKILRKELLCKVVFEDESTLIFHDIKPCVPVHLVAIPKGKFISFLDFSCLAPADVIKQFWLNIRYVIEKNSKLKNGCRLITNYGVNGGQTVPHFHVHILGGKSFSSLSVL